MGRFMVTRRWRRWLESFFDNMGDRPIRGSTSWKRYAINALLSQETKWLNYGIVLVGRGMMWADNFRVMVWSEKGNWVDF